MAKKINLTSGSILAGNPITFTIQPEQYKNPSFHRVIVEVTYDKDGSYETIQLNVPITKEGNDVEIDVSSALRVPLEDYEYTPQAATYPMVKWYIRAYDEYMGSNGEVHTNVGEQYYPQKPDASTGGATNLRCIIGAFSDIERLTSGVSKDVTSLSRKPKSSPEMAVIGDEYAYTPAYAKAQSLATSSSLVAPASRIETITKEGLQTIGEHSVYAIPQSEATHRMNFRFINSFGVLESINVPRSYSEKISIQSEEYTVAKIETFNSFSRSAINKRNNRESWLFVTDPLDKSWLRWYLHEFLMSEHVWIDVNCNWIPCTLTSEEEITMMDRTNTNMYSVSFTAKLDIYGSPIL